MINGSHGSDATWKLVDRIPAAGAAHCNRARPTGATALDPPAMERVKPMARILTTSLVFQVHVPCHCRCGAAPATRCA